MNLLLYRNTLCLFNSPCIQSLDFQYYTEDTKQLLISFFGIISEVHHSLFWIFNYCYPLIWTILRHFSSMVFLPERPRFNPPLQAFGLIRNRGFWVGKTHTSLMFCLYSTFSTILYIIYTTFPRYSTFLETVIIMGVG